jgi:hypothetical protein
MTARTRSFQRHQKTTATPTATHVYAPFSTIITQFICIFGNFHIKFQSTATHPILIAQQRNQHQNDRRITLFPTPPQTPRHPHCHARHNPLTAALHARRPLRVPRIQHQDQAARGDDREQQRVGWGACSNLIFFVKFIYNLTDVSLPGGLLNCPIFVGYRKNPNSHGKKPTFYSKKPHFKAAQNPEKHLKTQLL